jgi:rhodanese-related sulfurtransferase
LNIIINIILLLILILVILYPTINRLRAKRVATFIDEETFKAGMRTAQVIDIREAAEFKRRHILGARNVPASQVKAAEFTLRKDKPIYLYDNKKAQLAGGVALILKKKGYQDIYILKKGIDSWTGKIKEKS